MEKERARELKELTYNIRELKSLFNLLNNEKENDDEHLYNFIINEYDNIVRYPPQSNPPINYFDDPYSIQKGLNNIFNRFVID